MNGERSTGDRARPGVWPYLRSMLGTAAFRVARSRLGGRIVGWSFSHMTGLMPIERLYETETVVAFHHPRPLHPTHILIVPKRPISSVLALTEHDATVLADVLATLRHLVTACALESSGYRLEVNGGAFQDVPQLHFHLVSSKPC